MSLRRLLASVTLAAVAVAGAASPSARADDPDAEAMQVVTLGNQFIPGDDAFGTGTLRVLEGGRLQYTNLDLLASHDVVHEGCREVGDECLFASPTVRRADGTVEVIGVSDLDAGSYPFYCSVHPTTMFGTLIVEELL